MTFHILNGDALADKFPISIGGDVIIIKEAFIEGPLTTDFDEPGYWARRAQFITGAYQEDPQKYMHQFVSEQVGKMQSIQANDEVYLWFEDDLFCQANMWFSVYYITRFSQPKFYRIFPSEDHVSWSGFGNSESEELIELYQKSCACSKEDIEFVNVLWEVYARNDLLRMKSLSVKYVSCIRFLPEVIQAHMDRIPGNYSSGKPKELLRAIIDEGKSSSFAEIFSAFYSQAGIYGFGDTQVKNMLEEMGFEVSS